MAYSLQLNSGLILKSEINSAENSNCNKNLTPFLSKDLIAAAGFNVDTPILEAIIGNLTGTLPTRKTEMIKCKICDCELSSSTALNIHTNGLKHRKRLKALEIIRQLKIANDNRIQFTRDVEYPKIFRCEICSKTVNSAQQLEVHLSGTKHKRKVVRAGINKNLSHPLRKNLEFSDNTDKYTAS